MADLIIKPSSGNDLVIQGGDNSPAITVGNTGTTTFAENATLSGTANNLGTVTAGTFPAPSATALYPAGHVLQTKGTNSNSTWGAVGHSNEFHLPNQDVQLTTKGLNSNYFIMGRFNSDDTNSGTFGTGLAFRYIISGSSEVSLFTAHAHEIYDDDSINKYRVSTHQHYFSITAAIGTVITFKSYGRFNNSNGQSSSNPGAMTQSSFVMEIQS